MQTQQTAATAAAERGIMLVESHQSRQWLDSAAEAIADFLRTHGPATIDEARQWAVEVAGVALPTSANAWGALTRSMARRRLIRATGQFRQATSASSHARWAAVWEVVL